MVITKNNTLDLGKISKSVLTKNFSTNFSCFCFKKLYSMLIATIDSSYDAPKLSCESGRFAAEPSYGQQALAQVDRVLKALAMQPCWFLHGLVTAGFCVAGTVSGTTESAKEQSGASKRMLSWPQTSATSTYAARK